MRDTRNLPTNALSGPAINRHSIPNRSALQEMMPNSRSAKSDRIRQKSTETRARSRARTREATAFRWTSLGMDCPVHSGLDSTQFLLPSTSFPHPTTSFPRRRESSSVRQPRTCGNTGTVTLVCM